LLLLLACPALVASASARPLSWADWLLACSYLALVLVEGWADQQQYDFQSYKWSVIKAGGKLQFPYRYGSCGFVLQLLFLNTREI
jgi:steroid 5-alpha reductase family enzyme